MEDNSDSDWNWDFFNEIIEDVDENRNIIQCISCGKCVGDCPAAKVSNFNSRKIIQRVLKGDRSVLKDSDIWHCYLCERCKKICPKDNVNIPLLIINLRNESFKKGYGPRYNDLRKYVEMAERFLTSGVVVDQPLGEKIPPERIDELNEICNFARIKYVFKASKTNKIKSKKLIKSGKD
jgi:heterodisulfide reductase subunit C